MLRFLRTPCTSFGYAVLPVGLLLIACQPQTNPTSPPLLSPSVTVPVDPNTIVVIPITTPLPPMLWERRDTGIPAYTFVTGFIDDEAGWWIRAYDDTGLWSSPDKGMTWQSLRGLAVSVLAIAQTGTTRWLANSNGLWHGEETGWSRIEGLQDEEVLDLTTDGETVYATLGRGGLWKIEGDLVTSVSVPRTTWKYGMCRL